MKYIGLDLGSVTCGVSRSVSGLFATTVETIRFHPGDYNEAMDRILELLKREEPDLIVLGYPLMENGDVGERAQISEEFGRILRIESGIEVRMQDERSTTKDSEEILIAADVSRKKRKKVIDQLAAQRILQYWLDANREEFEHE